MSLASLTAAFPVTETVTSDSADRGAPEPLAGLFRQLAGTTFAHGFLRFHTPESAAESAASCARLIDGFEGSFHPFAFDWLGREVALDVRAGETRRLVIVVDPGGGEYLGTECDLDEWHEVVAGEDDALAFSFYEEWRAAVPSAGALRRDQAVGYKVPLFLGGEDEVENLHLVDREVYFELCTQAALQVRDLPPGTPISEVTSAFGQ
ncbi:T6SS immunity protein Tdi1 domain-containing protein [Streptomyces monomycini]|uniref:T6SS immunity protein Tdi1 domain-containing protein n=1 Tax=Streptomyces monomycini TaxID=371720 RepID=UPI00067DBF84|nr:T6SS immunity protein Tdi1 domain-containing protein [Streptomyces monomycini]